MDGESPKDPNVEFVGLMPVAPANPPGGLTASAPTPSVPTPAVPTPAVPTPATTAAVGANRAVRAANQAAQHAQAIIAAGNIGDPQVIPAGVCPKRRA
jgi:hypothetical protein